MKCFSGVLCDGGGASVCGSSTAGHVVPVLSPSRQIGIEDYAYSIMIAMSIM